jgi:tetratricopeptide (TPR) repeat protein
MQVRTDLVSGLVATTVVLGLRAWIGAPAAATELGPVFAGALAPLLANVGANWASSITASIGGRIYRRVFGATATTDDSDGDAALTAVLTQGYLALFQGELDQAESRFADTLTISRAIGARVLEGIALSNVATVQSRRGKVHDAIAIWTHALRVHDDSGDRAAAMETLIGLGDAYIRIGASDQARDCLLQALAYCHALGNQPRAALAEQLLARLSPAAED